MLTKTGMVISTLLIMFALSATSFGSSKEATLLVVPGRPAIAAVAIDLVGMRDNVFVALYQQNLKTGELVIHLWDARKGDWVKVAADEYSTGKISDPVTAKVIVIGNDPVLMGKMEHISTWGTLMRVQTLDIMQLVNALNDVLTFTPGEWEYLAKRHDLKLQDLNADRRHYGRYGKPGETGSPVVSSEPVVKTSTTVTTKSVEQPPVPITTTSTAPEDK
jgi:hypothetical protein